jgi:tRNA pseudouridine55 synthase
VTGQSGLVVVDKPAGMTSHDVVARVRRVAGTRKVGHAGTLDDAVRDGLAGMVGEIDQRPSSVSAVKIDGQRAYARVRAGEDVVLPTRRVRIDAIDVLDIRHGDGIVDVDVAVRCSSGTYVRAIARDLGAGLGVGGHLTALRRTSVGPFTLAQAGADLDHLAVVPIAEAARAAFPSVDLTAEQAQDVRFGRRLALTLADGPHAVFAPDGDFLALYERAGDGARAVAVFV